MTYINPRGKLVRHRRRARAQVQTRPALGGVFDIIFGGGGTTPMAAAFEAIASATKNPLDCITEANTRTASMDARWYNLAQNWHPTGYYTPDDTNKILQTGIVALTQAKVIVLLAPRTTSDADTVINQAIDDIDKQWQDAQRFVNAIGAAKAQGIAVAAPDLKDWLTKSLLVASNGYMVRAVLECNATWLDQADYYVTQAYNVAVTIEGIAVDAVTSVVNVAAGAFDAAKFVTSYAKYGFLAVGAYLVWSHLKKK
jgi:hypothetical protein